MNNEINYCKTCHSYHPDNTPCESQITLQEGAFPIWSRKCQDELNKFHEEERKTLKSLTERDRKIILECNRFKGNAGRVGFACEYNTEETLILIINKLSHSINGKL